jgi:hypothetical protein
MNPQPDDASPRADPSLGDEHIFCPVCRYNLTGNASGRCPECGSLFDRRTLIRAQRVAAVDLIPWDSPDESLSRPRRWWETVKITCVRPRRFSLAFGAMPQESDAVSFLFSCLALGTLGVWVAIGLISWALGVKLPDKFVLYAGVGCTIHVWAGLFGATFLTAAIYAILIPHADGRRRLGPWLAIVMYAGSHCLFLLLMPALAVVSVSARWRGVPPELWFFTWYVAVGLMCVLLWVATLADVVRQRCLDVGLVTTAQLATIACGLGWPLLVAFGLGALFVE